MSAYVEAIELCEQIMLQPGTTKGMEYYAGVLNGLVIAGEPSNSKRFQTALKMAQKYLADAA